MLVTLSVNRVILPVLNAYNLLIIVFEFTYSLLFSRVCIKEIDFSYFVINNLGIV